MMNELDYSDYFFTREGQRIFYTTNFPMKDYDSNRPIIVLNYGLVCNIAHWKEQIPYFQEKGYQILSHDYRFHFRSTSDGHISECTFTNITDDLFQLLSEFKIENSIMIGHSMGVNIALESAKKFPHIVKSMVLISGTVLPPQDVMFDSNIIEIIAPYIDFLTKRFPHQFKKFWQSAYKNPLARHFIHRGGFNIERVPQEFVELYLKRIGELPPDIFLHLLNEMKNHRVLNHLEKIKTPALVIGGDKDQVIPNYLQRILHDHLPNSELYIVKDGSHVPQADFPQNINERINLFISG